MGLVLSAIINVISQDILRGHYQQLSADPNSLANLDQGESLLAAFINLLTKQSDLPNNLQREVPIVSRFRTVFRYTHVLVFQFSLPEDWLWVCCYLLYFLVFSDPNTVRNMV